MAVKKKTKAIILAAVCVLIIAAIALSAVLIYRSTPQFVLNEAGKYIDMGDYKSAIIALEEALIKFPDNADIRLALSEAYELSGDTENALRVLTEYIELYDVPENRRNELEHRIVKLGGSIDSAFGAITSGGATRNNDPGQDTDSTTASDLNNTVVYSSDNVPAELMGDPPASADEVVKMINDYLQYGTEPDRNALKYVTNIQIAGDRCLWVSIKGFDMEVYSNHNAVEHYDTNEESGESILSDTVFDIYHQDLEYNIIEEDTEIVPWGTITDISFIPKYFPYLVGLEISFNRINDISPLKGMTGLRYLGMGYNEIDDISALSGMTQMQSLWLIDNNISDISALSDMTQMQYLSLDCNVISDISALSGMAKIQDLSLANNNISDISALTKLSQIEYLWLDNNHIRDLTPITGLTKLSHFSVYNNTDDDYAEDIDFSLPLLSQMTLNGFTFGNITFSDMPDLESIYLKGKIICNEFNISSLQSLKNISFDDVSADRVSFSELPELWDINFEVLSCSEVKLSDLPALKSFWLNGYSRIESLAVSDLPQLETLWLGGGEFSDIEIHDLPMCEFVSLRYNNDLKITNLKIYNMKSLSSVFELGSEEYPADIDNVIISNCDVVEYITFDSCNLKSIKISDLPQLDDINLKNNMLANISISSFPKLSDIDLRKNSLINIYLADLPALDVVWLKDNNLSDVTIASLKEKFPAAHIYF